MSLFSSVWAERQVASFTGRKENPDLHELTKTKIGGETLQTVDINLEENLAKAWLVRIFMGRMRRQVPKEQHERYFLVRKGVDESIKEAIGMMNSRVGYVYLLDENCRIRWAGSGSAEGNELSGLNKGVRKLIDERGGIHGSQAGRQEDTDSVKPRVVMRS